MSSRSPSHRGRAPLVAGGAAIVVLAGAAGALVGNAVDSGSSAAPAVATVSACNVTKVARENLPSVVTISVANAEGQGSVGSGEVIRSQGYILTNNHVVAPAAGGGSLHVIFDNGSSAQATIVGRDPLTDLAVIRVEESGLRAISIGDSSDLEVGQPVVALGAPLGLSSSVTSGIVSALGRAVQVPGEGSQPALLIDAVQTDASINPGNSGGALVDCEGALVGVPTAGASVPSANGESSGGSIGLGFAIPVNLATKVAGEIISTGGVTHGFLGLQAQPLPPDEGLSNGAPGLWVGAVTAGGPAAGAGLRAGDIIRTIEGSQATSVDQLTALTLTKRPGDQVELGYEREGRSDTATVTLGAQSAARGEAQAEGAAEAPEAAGG